MLALWPLEKSSSPFCEVLRNRSWQLFTMLHSPIVQLPPGNKTYRGRLRVLHAILHTSSPMDSSMSAHIFRCNKGREFYLSSATISRRETEALPNAYGGMVPGVSSCVLFLVGYSISVVLERIYASPYIGQSCQLNWSTISSIVLKQYC